ncbi:hypothetical protein BTVI_115630 [Pitangus sulphuratus]|nr:hypothetical protein BTVI_115630 [Pitangus sulphuratus]
MPSAPNLREGNRPPKTSLTLDSLGRLYEYPFSAWTRGRKRLLKLAGSPNHVSFWQLCGCDGDGRKNNVLEISPVTQLVIYPLEGRGLQEPKRSAPQAPDLGTITGLSPGPYCSCTLCVVFERYVARQLGIDTILILSFLRIWTADGERQMRSSFEADTPGKRTYTNRSTRPTMLKSLA